MENKKKKKLLIIIMLIFVICTSIYTHKLDNKKEYYLSLDVDRVNEQIDYKKIINNLKEKYNNEDVKGILEINNTDYKVPIVQGTDNDYYLSHDAYKKENFMGAIYLDYRVDIDSSKKILIYGHNSSRIDMPFKILEEFYDKDYYSNHKNMWITTSTTRKEYEIFSVHVEPIDYSYMNLNFANDEEYLNHLKKLKAKSMYDTGVEVSSTDEILILQTCSTHKDYSNYNKKYLLIILRRV